LQIPESLDAELLAVANIAWDDDAKTIPKPVAEDISAFLHYSVRSIRVCGHCLRVLAY